MRGDSLRDLYAKTLALVGLGVLAAVGALFDYWPAGIRLVPAAPALELPELAASFPEVPAVSSPESTSIAGHPPRRPRPSLASLPVTPATDIRLTSVSEPLRPLAPEASLTFATADAPLPEAVFMTASFSADHDATDAPLSVQALSVREDPYEDPAGSLLGRREPVALVDSGTGADDDGGFLSDALRKTRTSLVRTGARTGASIVDAVRVVGGAVRRALPN